MRGGAIVVVLALVVSACAEPGVGVRVDADHADGEAGTSALHADAGLARQGAEAAGSRPDLDRRAADQRAQPVLRHSRAPWIASVSVPMGRGERLPSIFTEAVVLNFDDVPSGGKVGLRTLADRITAATGVPVRLKADVFAGGAQGPVSPTAPPTPFALPTLGGGPGSHGVGAPPPPRLPSIALASDTRVDAVAMRWAGSLEGYLDLVTDQLSLSWEYRDGAVVIERLRTEFFEVAALESETDYHLGLSGADQANATSASGSGGGTTSSASSSNEVIEHGRSNATGSILAAIDQIIRDVPGSSAVRSEDRKSVV